MIKFNGRRAIVGAAAVSAAILAAPASAGLVFDTFNTGAGGAGHFGYAPTFTTHTAIVGASSSNGRSTISTLEGAGSDRLVLTHDATTTAARYRHLSGGPPYDSTNAGNPVGNVPFQITAGTDGKIGFYAMSQADTQAAWTITLALDGPAATTAELTQAAPKNLINDGVWRLYEWDLDAVADWQVVAGIGGNATLETGQATIDSIILRNASAVAGNANAVGTFFIDFVAKTDPTAGETSIAQLVPEPGAIGLLAAAGLGALRRRRRGA